MVPNILENSVDHANRDSGEYCEVPEELARLLRLEEKAILPYLEDTKVINPGTEEVKREIKIGDALQSEEKKGLIELLW